MSFVLIGLCITLFINLDWLYKFVESKWLVAFQRNIALMDSTCDFESMYANLLTHWRCLVICQTLLVFTDAFLSSLI